MTAPTPSPAPTVAGAGPVSGAYGPPATPAPRGAELVAPVRPYGLPVTRTRAGWSTVYPYRPRARPSPGVVVIIAPTEHLASLYAAAHGIPRSGWYWPARVARLAAYAGHDFILPPDWGEHPHAAELGLWVAARLESAIALGASQAPPGVQ